MKERYLFLSLLLLLPACSGKVQMGRPTVQYVREIIAGKNLPQHVLVEGYAPRKDGAVYILGPSGRCEPLQDEFVASDMFDNVDGSRRPDGLADFAGETLCCISDDANAPYRRFLDRGNEEELRVLNVKNVLAAMDTLSYVGSFDRAGMGRRPRAKVVVLSSPYASEYGVYDVDSLFSALGCTLPIVCPLKVMLDKVFDSRTSDAMIGVITTAENVASGAYSSIVQEISARHGLSGSDCVVFPSDTASADPLVSFLDRYMAAGYSRPLDALLIDDYDIDPDAIAVNIKLFTDPSEEGAMGYGNLFAKDFKLLDARRSAVSECYRILRSGNLFTHNIAQPKPLCFRTVQTDSLDIIVTQYAR